MKKSAHTIRFAAHNLEEKDHLVFHSLVELLGHNSGIHCQMVNAASADALIIDTDSEDGRNHYLRLIADSGVIPVAYCQNAPPSVSGHYLRKPIRGRQVLELLQTLGAKLFREQGTPAGARTAFMSLPELLDSALAFDYALLRGDSLPTILISRLENEILLSAPLNDYQRLSPADLGEVKLSQISDIDFQAHRADMNSAPLQSALWRLAIHCSNGRLLQRLEGESRFALWRWPDFGRVPHSPSHSRLAATFSGRAHTVSEATRRTSAAIGDVHAFLNACSLCGWLNQNQQTQGTIRSHVVSTPNQNMLGTALRLIRHRLGL